MPRRASLAVAFALVTAILAALSWSCRDECSGQPAPLGNTGALVRFIHAAPQAGAANLVIDGQTVVRDAHFNTYDDSTSCYRTSPAGPNVTIAASVPGGGAGTTAKLVPGEYYTVVLLGKLGDRILVLHDTLSSPGLDSSRIRIIHAVPDLVSMDAALAGRTLVRGLSFGAASPYVTVAKLLPKPIGQDTGSFAAYRTGDPSPFVQLPSGHVIVPGDRVFTIVILGEYSPNGTEPLASSTIFMDNVASMRGKGDVLLTYDYAAVRLFNGTNQQRTASMGIYNAVSASGFPPDWRTDFPGQERVQSVPLDSASSYLLLGFSNFVKGTSGQIQVGVRGQWGNFGTVITDSTSIEPFLKDHRYSALIYGAGPDMFSMKILWDTTATPPAGRAAVRFVNAESDAAALASLAELTHGSMAQGVATGAVSTSVQLPAGNATLMLTDDRGGSVNIPVTLASQQTYTAIALGSRATNDFRLVLCVK